MLNTKEERSRQKVLKFREEMNYLTIKKLSSTLGNLMISFPTCRVPTITPPWLNGKAVKEHLKIRSKKIVYLERVHDHQKPLLFVERAR